MTLSEDGTSIYLDAEHRFENSKLDYKWILMQAVNSTRMAGSAEMGPGRIEEHQGQHGRSKVYVPDSREVFINSVRILADLLLPYYDALVEKELLELVKAERKNGEELRAEYNGGARRDVFRLRDHIARMRLRFARQRFRVLIRLMSRADLIENTKNRRSKT